LIRQHDQLAGTDQQVRDAQGILAWAGMLDLWASIFAQCKAGGFAGRRWPVPAQRNRPCGRCDRGRRRTACAGTGGDPRCCGPHFHGRIPDRRRSPPSNSRTSDGIIGPLAWAAVDLRGYESLRLKRCPRHDCRWLFIDRTNNRSRRWCEWPPAETAQRCDRAGKPTGA
jgi:hypothetical protein